MSRQRRIILIVFFACAALILFVVAQICTMFATAYSTSPTDTIRQQTENVLQHPETQNFCGTWLSDVLRRNNRQYAVHMVGVWGDYASPIPGGTGSISALVNVDFPDGTRIEFEYYAYTLLRCQLLRLPRTITN